MGEGRAVPRGRSCESKLGWSRAPRSGLARRHGAADVLMVSSLKSNSMQKVERAGGLTLWRRVAGLGSEGFFFFHNFSFFSYRFFVAGLLKCRLAPLAKRGNRKAEGKT